MHLSYINKELCYPKTKFYHYRDRTFQQNMEQRSLELQIQTKIAEFKMVMSGLTII